MERLLGAINTPIFDVVMIPGKSYCFIRCTSTELSQLVYAELHGRTKLAQNDGVLYCSYSVDGKNNDGTKIFLVS